MNRKGRKPKRVEQIDIDSGEFIDLYDSVAENEKSDCMFSRLRRSCRNVVCVRR